MNTSLATSDLSVSTAVTLLASGRLAPLFPASAAWLLPTAVIYIVGVLVWYARIELQLGAAPRYGWGKPLVLIARSTAVGVGLWSLDLLMLLSERSMPAQGSLGAIPLALFTALVTAGITLYLTHSRRYARLRHSMIGGALIGCGLALMHGIGLATMLPRAGAGVAGLPTPALFGLSLGVATTGLWLAVQDRDSIWSERLWIWFKFTSALVIGGTLVGLLLGGAIGGLWQLGAPGAALALALIVALILGFGFLPDCVAQHYSARTAAFDSLYLCHPDAVFALDSAGVIIGANPAALELVAQPFSRLRSLPFTDLLSAEETRRGVVADALQRVSAGQSTRYEMTLGSAGANQRVLAVTSVPIVIGSQVIGIHVFARDISAIRQAERERERLIAIIEATTDVIGTADPQGNIVYCNQAGRRLFGWPSTGPIIGHTLQDVFSPANHDDLFGVVLPGAMSEGVWSGESELMNAQQQPVPTSQVIVAHRNDDGSIAYLSGIARDISDRKRAEQALQAAQALLEERIAIRTAELQAANSELARAARLKNEFLANMSHELRTPLNAILGLSEGVQEGVYGALNGEQANALRLIEESGRHLLTLINDILDLSKIEAGKLTLNRDILSPADVGMASLRMVAQIAHQKDITITSRIPVDLPVIWADARRVKQVLVNLLSNAVKFTPAGGRVGLDVVVDQEAQAMAFTVWDNGIGIAPDDMGRLFQPFVQVDSSFNRQYEGSGLGLVLVQRMMQLHGGSVQVCSAPGSGSRFTVRLPLDLPEEARRLLDAIGQLYYRPEARPATLPPSVSPTTPGPNAPGQTILLVEDNAANVAVVKSYLDAKGYQVCVASSGSEALGYLDRARPDLILMDIQMPDMDGFETIRHIRDTPGLCRVPIIALTALAMAGDRERCLENGADDYISKPVRLRHLTMRIEAHLRTAPVAA